MTPHSHPPATPTSTPTPSREQFPHLERLRVRWQEVDAQQVVFNGHYLGYLDVAMSSYWRAIAMPYPDALRALDGDVFVRHNSLSHHAPARLDDWLDLGLRCEGIGRSSIRMAWALWCDHRLLVTGEVVYVWTSLSQGGAAAVPRALRAQIEAHAAGGPVMVVRTGPWSEWGTLAAGIRQAVFVQEQAIPADEEWDHLDPSAVHAVAQNLAGFPLATGRLVTQEQGEGQAVIGRMAVIKPMRGTGAGRQVFEALVRQATGLGCREVVLHAQTAARGFYEKSGFAAQGEPFDEVGIPHVMMSRRLTGPECPPVGLSANAAP